MYDGESYLLRGGRESLISFNCRVIMACLLSSLLNIHTYIHTYIQKITTLIKPITYIGTTNAIYPNKHPFTYIQTYINKTLTTYIYIQYIRT